MKFNKDDIVRVKKNKCYELAFVVSVEKQKVYIKYHSNGRVGISKSELILVVPAELRIDL